MGREEREDWGEKGRLAEDVDVCDIRPSLFVCRDELLSSLAAFCKPLLSEAEYACGCKWFVS